MPKLGSLDPPNEFVSLAACLQTKAQRVTKKKKTKQQVTSMKPPKGFQVVCQRPGKLGAAKKLSLLVGSMETPTKLTKNLKT